MWPPLSFPLPLPIILEQVSSTLAAFSTPYPQPSPGSFETMQIPGISQTYKAWKSAFQTRFPLPFYAFSISLAFFF